MLRIFAKRWFWLTVFAIAYAAMWTVANEAKAESVFKFDARGGGKRTECSAIIVASGYAVTNRHCTEGLDRGTLSLDGMKGAIARVACRSDDDDLALLKFSDALDLKSIELGSDPTSLVAVTVIGYPNGGPIATRQGKVLGLAQVLPDKHDLIMHSTETEIGDSGGAVLDPAGKLIGVNVARVRSGKFALAVKVSTVVGFMRQCGVQP